MSGIFLLCLFLAAAICRAQGLYPVSGDEKVRNASLIVEGKVISRSSFWNPSHTMIYTSNEVEVYKIFKGSLQKNTVNVVTIGGAVGNHVIQATHLLELNKDDIGMFFLHQPPYLHKIKTGAELFDVFSSSQGFLKYDLLTKTAVAPFEQYDDVEKTLYKTILDKTGRLPVIRNRSFSVQSESLKMQSDHSTLAPVITSFSPQTVHAGALLDPENNELTINGTGFGNNPGGSAAVLFSHPDFSPGTQFSVIPYDHQFIVSWTDTRIVVKVPTQAGTGAFRVRDNAGNVVNSPTSLQVLFTILTADFGGAYGIKQFNLGNMNGTGGYSIKYSTSTANSGVNINASPAKATFQRALTTWKESIGLNFIEAGITSQQVVNPDDGENLVMYDNGGTGLDAPLASGVLATCFSGITICTNDPANNQARKNGFDIVIRNTGFSSGNTPFTLGPCPPYAEQSNMVDLESVLLHELGHALNLGHIVDPLEGTGSAGTLNPAKLMHYAVTMNQRRISIDYAAKAGGEYQVTPQSHSYGNCVVGNAEMTPLTVTLEPKDDCPAEFPVSATPEFTTVNFDLIHSTSNKFVDPAYDQMITDGTGTNITNNAYYAFRTDQSGGELSLEIKNYSTNPLTIEDCPTGQTGIAVTGVKLALYKVNGCPNGGEYPTPIATRTFSSAANLTAITGLTGNSTYLLVVDGIQNTKAIFDIVFSGNALPVLSTNLVGEVKGNTNHLSWTTDPAFNVVKLIIERGNDGLTFTELEEIFGAQQQSGEYDDLSPLPGINYYRLRIENASGIIQYSQILMINRANEFAMNVYPHPTRSNLNVQILSSEPGPYALLIHNAHGQKVFQKQINVVSRNHVENLYVGGLPQGVYFITAISKSGKKLKAGMIRVN